MIYLSIYNSIILRVFIVSKINTCSFLYQTVKFKKCFKFCSPEGIINDFMKGRVVSARIGNFDLKMYAFKAGLITWVSFFK